MRQIRHDLWETAAFSPFDPLTTHAYLWTPPDGANVLFYAPGDATDFDHIAELGGVAHHYLSHQDEAGPALALVRSRFGAALYAAAAEREAVAEFAEPDVLLDHRHTAASGVEVIPTPGHTPGSISYIATSSDGARYLFTGDSLFVDRAGRWAAGNIPGYSDPEALAASLDLLAGLDPTLVASSAFGMRGVSDIDATTWPAEVRGLADSLRLASSGRPAR